MDYFHVVGTGNGVEHVTVNKAQDGWFTSTFTGNITITAYPATSLSFDAEGNVTGIIGAADGSLPVFSGKLTEWFGGSFNNKNTILHSTQTVMVSGGGLSVSVHATGQTKWAVGADPNGPPTSTTSHVHC